MPDLAERIDTALSEIRALIAGLWFGYTAWRRAHLGRERTSVPAAIAS
jgi:hypothetical protein